MRIGTRTLKVTAWLSAAAFALLFVCWVASFWGDVMRIERQSWVCSICRGEFVAFFGLLNGQTDFHLFMPGLVGEAAGVRQIPRWHFLNGRWQEGRYVVPLWLPAACSLAIGVPAFVTLRCRARALKNGACLKCGYMLTGLPPAAPRPECGRAA